MKSFSNFLLEKPTPETKRGGSTKPGTNSGGGDPWFDPEVEKQILDAQQEEDPFKKKDGRDKLLDKMSRDKKKESIKASDATKSASDKSYRGAKVKGKPRPLGAFRSNTTVNKKTLSTVPLGSTDASDPKISDRLDKVRKQRIDPNSGRSTKTGIQDFLTKSKTKNLTVDSKKGQQAMKDVDAIMKKGRGKEYQHAKKSIEGTRVKGKEGVRKLIKSIPGKTTGKSELGKVKGYYAPSDYSGKRAKVATTKQITGYTDALKKSGALTKKGGKLIIQKRPGVSKLETSTRKGYVHKPIDLSKVTHQTSSGNTVTGNYGGSIDDVSKPKPPKSNFTSNTTGKLSDTAWRDNTKKAFKPAKTFKQFASKLPKPVRSAGKLLKNTGGRLVGPAFAVADGWGNYKGYKKQGYNTSGALARSGAKTGAYWGGWAAGAKGGAALGASIGSVVPGVGTAIGGAVGGVLGGFAGGHLAGKTADWAIKSYDTTFGKQKLKDIKAKNVAKMNAKALKANPYKNAQPKISKNKIATDKGNFSTITLRKGKDGNYIMPKGFKEVGKASRVTKLATA